MKTDPTPSAGRIRFADFEVDVRSHELLRGGRRVRLQEKSFLVLQQLLERPGGVVTREELAAALWPKEYFVDAEHGLNTAVRRLREALGDSADAPRYVETLPRIGYRFIGAIEAGGTSGDPRGVHDTAPVATGGTLPLLPVQRAPEAAALPAEPAAARRSSRPRPLVAAAVLAGAALAILGAWFALSRSTSTPAPAASSEAGSGGTVEELLARARYLRNHKRYAEAKQFVEEALRLDPRNADALAGLALGLLGEKRYQEGRETALRALEIDPDAWEAHRALGNYARRVNDMAGAERHFRRAVEANPSDYKTRNRLGRILLECGRFDEAREQILESKRLAPDDPDVQNIWVEHAFRTGDYEGAIRQGEIWTAIWEKSYPRHWIRDLLGLAYVGARRHEEAIEQFRGLGPGSEVNIALALGHAGRIAEARAVLERHEPEVVAAGDAESADAELAGSLARAYVAIGDLDRAFTFLEREVEAGEYPGWVHDRLFEAVRKDSRWPGFAERLQREFFQGKESAVQSAEKTSYWPGPSPAGDFPQAH